jgi:gentisate 1,2-dioxygenase
MNKIAKVKGELEEFEERLAAKSLGGHWQMVQRMMEMQELVPVVWRWTDILESLDTAGKLIQIGGADDVNDRRTIHLVNPSLADLRHTSGIIQVAIQLIKPGESAEAHRHSQNALRFVVETKDGMYTTVNGEEMLMEPGDLVLSPNWTWHDHTNKSEKPAIWIDILDVNLLHRMGGHFKEVWPEGALQNVLHPNGYSQKRFGSVRPSSAKSAPDALPYAYKWTEAVAALKELAAAGEQDPHEGILLEYVHPRSGGWTFPTIACRAQMLPPRSKTRALRRVGITFCHVVSGKGVTVVGPGEGGFGTKRRSPSKARDTETLNWVKHDCFMVPSWRWQEYQNPSDEPVFLFSITERPGLEALGWYHEEKA